MQYLMILSFVLILGRLGIEQVKPFGLFDQFNILLFINFEYMIHFYRDKNWSKSLICELFLLLIFCVSTEIYQRITVEFQLLDRPVELWFRFSGTYYETLKLHLLHPCWDLDLAIAVGNLLVVACAQFQSGDSLVAPRKSLQIIISTRLKHILLIKRGFEGLISPSDMLFLAGQQQMTISSSF